MSPEGYATIAGIAVNLFTAGVIYGSLQRQTKNNTKDIEALKDEVRLEQDQQWSKINDTAETVSFIRGQNAATAPNGRAKGAS